MSKTLLLGLITHNNYKMEYCPNCNHNLKQYRKKPIEGTSDDPIYQDVKNLVQKRGKISVALLQDEFGIGYVRASNIIDTLEDEKVIENSDTDMIKKLANWANTALARALGEKLTS